jgi:hypothetical protein
MRGYIMIVSKQIRIFGYSNFYPCIFLKIFEVVLCLNPKTSPERRIENPASHGLAGQPPSGCCTIEM